MRWPPATARMSNAVSKWSCRCTVAPGRVKRFMDSPGFALGERREPGIRSRFGWALRIFYREQFRSRAYHDARPPRKATCRINLLRALGRSALTVIRSCHK
jgi:hypothetical protein